VPVVEDDPALLDGADVERLGEAVDAATATTSGETSSPAR